jgi:hypothetical protein
MKTFETFFLATAVTLIASLSVFAGPPEKGAESGGKGHGHGGMSGDFQGVIHSLFAAHEKVNRAVELTDDGYRATTTSDNPEVAAMLKKHVAQMESRLEGGLGVRHWDPAFVELHEHYEDMSIKVENVEKGVAVSVAGTTPDAIKVAQNHAAIVSGFVKKGEEQMHATHAAVVTKAEDASVPAKEGAGGCESCKPGKSVASATCEEGQCGKGNKPCCAALEETATTGSKDPTSSNP